MFEVSNPLHREFMYRVWKCLELSTNPGASIVKDETTGGGIDAVGKYADSFFVGGECPPLEVQSGEVLCVPRRGGGRSVILVSSAVENWLEQNNNMTSILGVWWDSDIQKAVLDQSTDVSGLDTALVLARSRGEKEIWSTADSTCYPVA